MERTQRRYGKRQAGVSSENAWAYLAAIENKLNKLEKLENMLVTMRTDNLETRRLLLRLADQINMQVARTLLEKTEEQHTQGYTAEQLAERLARGEMVVEPRITVGKHVIIREEDPLDVPYSPISPSVHSPRDYGDASP
jgi:hypothetical protein